MVFLLCSHRPREAAVSSVTAGSTPAVWCVVAGPPPERTLSMSCPPWSACQDWILASTPSSPSLTVSAQFTQAFPTLHLERKTNREWPHTGRKSFKNIFQRFGQSPQAVMGVMFPWISVVFSVAGSFYHSVIHRCPFSFQSLVLMCVFQGICFISKTKHEPH